VRGAAVRTRLVGSFEVFAPSISACQGPTPTQLASKAALRDGRRGNGGHRSGSSRTPNAGPRSCTCPSAASAPTANRRP
jgi:hypothetical protein